MTEQAPNGWGEIEGGASTAEAWNDPLNVEIVEAIRTFATQVARPECDAELGQYIDVDFHLPPAVLAQIIMNELPLCGNFGLDRKAYWMEVAAYLGPDWIAEFRKMGAFMRAVDGFQ